jgi:hypothetical protein
LWEIDFYVADVSLGFLFHFRKTILDFFCTVRAVWESRADIRAYGPSNSGSSSLPFGLTSPTDPRRVDFSVCLAFYLWVRWSSNFQALYKRDWKLELQYWFFKMKKRNPKEMSIT